MSLKKLRLLALKSRGQAPTAPEPEPNVVIEEPVLVEHPLSLSPPEPKPKKKKKPKVKSPSLTVALEALMVSAIKAQYGESVITKRWGVKERTLAKKLATTYSLEMTERVIKKFVEEWPSMVRSSRGRLYGLPTINFLWSAQDRFFGAEQIGESITSPANIDEYQGLTDTDDDW